MMGVNSALPAMSTAWLITKYEKTSAVDTARAVAIQKMRGCSSSSRTALRGLEETFLLRFSTGSVSGSKKMKTSVMGSATAAGNHSVERQPSFSVSRPPTNGPTSAPKAEGATNKPRPKMRRSGGNTSKMQPLATANTEATDAPAAILPSVSAQSVGEKVERVSVTQNNTRQAMSTVLRPYLSLSGEISTGMIPANTANICRHT